MSTEQTGLAGEGEYLKIVNQHYIKFELVRKDWCGYKSNCSVDNVNIRDSYIYCLFCKHLKKLDIAKMIDEAKEDM